MNIRKSSKSIVTIIKKQQFHQHRNINKIENYVHVTRISSFKSKSIHGIENSTSASNDFSSAKTFSKNLLTTDVERSLTSALTKKSQSSNFTFDEQPTNDSKSHHTAVHSNKADIQNIESTRSAFVEKKTSFNGNSSSSKSANKFCVNSKVFLVDLNDFRHVKTIGRKHVQNKKRNQLCLNHSKICRVIFISLIISVVIGIPVSVVIILSKISSTISTMQTTIFTEDNQTNTSTSTYLTSITSTTTSTNNSATSSTTSSSSISSSTSSDTTSSTSGSSTTSSTSTSTSSTSSSTSTSTSTTSSTSSSSTTTTTTSFTSSSSSSTTSSTSSDTTSSTSDSSTTSSTSSSTTTTSSTSSSTTTTSSTSSSTTTTSSTSSDTTSSTSDSSATSSTSSSTTTTSSTSSGTTTSTTLASTVIPSNICTVNLTGIQMIASCNACSTVPFYVPFAYNFTAIGSLTRFVCATQRENGYFALDNVSVTSFLAPSVQILINGGFETGDLTGWSYCNPLNGSNPGGVKANSSHFTYLGVTYYPKSGSYYYVAGSLSYPDYLSQTFPTVIGQQYTISFWYEYTGNGTLSSASLFLGI